jgi:hypothetical protein
MAQILEKKRFSKEASPPESGGIYAKNDPGQADDLAVDIWARNAEHYKNKSAQSRNVP